MNQTVYVRKRLMRELRVVQVMWLLCAAAMLLFGVLEILRMCEILPPSAHVKRQVASSIILIIAALGLLFTLYQAWAQGQIIGRMKKVYLTVSDAGVQGVSFPNPARRDGERPDGEPFQAEIAQITDVRLRQQFFFPRQSSIRLEIETEEGTYSVPGIEDAHAIRDWLSLQISDKN